MSSLFSELFLICGTSITMVVTIGLALSDIGFGIGGAYIVANNYKAMNDEGAVWIIVLIFTCLCFLSIIFQMLHNYIKVSKDEKTWAGFFVNLAEFLQFCVAILADIVFFNSSQELIDHYVTNYPMLWTYINVLVVFYLILFSITGLMIFLMCFCFCCCRNTYNVRYKYRTLV
jgi:hypothetical protein